MREIQGNRGLSPYQVCQVDGGDCILKDAIEVIVQELEDVRLTKADICQRYQGRLESIEKGDR